MPSRLTYRHIEVIRSVMLNGSVTGAASSLHVTQPAISQILKEVDGLLTFTLFDRQQGRLIPTDRGRLLFDEIERSFIGLDLINEACIRLGISSQRTVTVALVPVVASSLLPSVVEEYRDKIADDFFRIEALTNEQVIGQVSARRADIGFALETVPVPGVKCMLLAEFEARCLLPSGHPLAGRSTVQAEDLAGMPAVRVPRADRLRDPVEEIFSRLEQPPRHVVECAAAHGACSMVEAGVGFAILDPVAAYPFRHSNIWFARFEPRVAFRFFAYWPDGRDPPFDRDAFLRLVQRRCLEIDKHCISAPG